MFEKVRDLVANQLNISADKITAESKIIEDLGADSLDTVELLMAFEDEFGVTIPDEDAGDLKTIGDIVAYIEKCNK